MNNFIKNIGNYLGVEGCLIAIIFIAILVIMDCVDKLKVKIKKEIKAEKVKCQKVLIWKPHQITDVGLAIERLVEKVDYLEKELNKCKK